MTRRENRSIPASTRVCASLLTRSNAGPGNRLIALPKPGRPWLSGVPTVVMMMACHGFQGPTGRVPERVADSTAAAAGHAVGTTAPISEDADSPAPLPPMSPRLGLVPDHAAWGRVIARGTASSPVTRRLRGQPGSGVGTTDNDTLTRLNREGYDRIEENPFLAVRDNPLSTFSADVDRAAYGNMRRYLGQLDRPPADAIRIEELVNYFPYSLPEPRGTDPLSISTDVMPAPWEPRHRLVRIALQSRRIAAEALPPSNLVFLVDVSGSMEAPDKLPLVKQSLRLLVEQLRPQDRVALVTYAGAAGVALPSTTGDQRRTIVEALDALEAGGGTAGGAGLELAYRVAREHFISNGNNRVILATDGDFNVGPSSDAALERLIEQKRRDGTYLTVLGFGGGNYQDAKMEKLAKHGNGNYAYVDELLEARKVMIREMGATLVTVANDVKIQAEFNPALVQAYRLIGYEDRLLRSEDFADDRRDAGDIGAGHQVTALYEVVPVGVKGTVQLPAVETSRYGTSRTEPPKATHTKELLFVKLRYKQPGDSTSRLLSHVVPNQVGAGDTDTRFAAAVASFGLLLRESAYKGSSSIPGVLRLARSSLGEDRDGFRADFVKLVEVAGSLTERSDRQR